MLPETTQQLILKLWDLTDRGVIPWKPGETDGEHLFETEGYVVAVSGQPPSVRILRPRGHEVERADAAELSATKWPRPNASRFDEAVRELATRAAEHANGARKTVAATMSAISTPHAPQRPPLPRPPANQSSARSSLSISAARPPMRPPTRLAKTSTKRPIRPNTRPHRPRTAPGSPPDSILNSAGLRTGNYPATCGQAHHHRRSPPRLPRTHRRLAPRAESASRTSAVVRPPQLDLIKERHHRTAAFGDTLEQAPIPRAHPKRRVAIAAFIDARHHRDIAQPLQTGIHRPDQIRNGRALGRTPADCPGNPQPRTSHHRTGQTR